MRGSECKPSLQIRVNPDVLFTRLKHLDYEEIAISLQPRSVPISNGRIMCLSTKFIWQTSAAAQLLRAWSRKQIQLIWDVTSCGLA